jgi:hypothetical protein
MTLCPRRPCRQQKHAPRRAAERRGGDAGEPLTPRREIQAAHNLGGKRVYFRLSVTNTNPRQRIGRLTALAGTGDNAGAVSGRSSPPAGTREPCGIASRVGTPKASARLHFLGMTLGELNIPARAMMARHEKPPPLTERGYPLARAGVQLFLHTRDGDAFGRRAGEHLTGGAGVCRLRGG